MKQLKLVVGTDNGLRRLAVDLQGGTHEVEVEKACAEAEMVVQFSASAPRASAENTVYVGTRGNGAFASSDGGQTWAKVHDGGAEGIARSFLRLSESEVLVGTEPAALFRVAKDETAEISDFRQVDGASEWYTPYSQHAGAVHALTRHPERPDTIFAAIEVGGVLRSDDRGNTWDTYSRGIHPDVHEVVADAHRSQRVYAATAGGVYRRDEGETDWRLLSDDLDGRYIRTVFLDPKHPDTVLAPISRTVGGPVRVYKSEDAGETWRLTDLITGSWESDFGFVNRISNHPDDSSLLVTVTEPGQIFVSDDAGESWRQLDGELECEAWGGIVV